MTVVFNTDVFTFCRTAHFPRIYHIAKTKYLHDHNKKKNPVAGVNEKWNNFAHNMSISNKPIIRQFLLSLV